MTLDSAVSRVFAVDELLEEILVYLTIDRVIMAKRVCKNWNRLIASSPPLQRILFKRVDLSRPLRIYNPLFEDFFQDIGCKDDVTGDGGGAKPVPAELKISPLNMRKLVDQCPKEWRSMAMFQPPCPYYLTLPSAHILNITVRFLNDADVPVMRAVEKANWIVEMEADKRRLHMARNSIEQSLRRNFARGVNSRLAGGAITNA